MKNRILSFIIIGLIAFALLGVMTSMISNPAGFFLRIAVILLVGAVIFFIFKRLSNAGPVNSEQKAFVRAAKRSKKRYQQQDSAKTSTRKTSVGSLTSIKKPKKKSAAHLTVIQGKKGKKKNRASL